MNNNILVLNNTVPLNFYHTLITGVFNEATNADSPFTSI